MQARPCFFQHGHFTGWNNEGLKVISDVADCNCVDREMCLLLTVFVVVVFLVIFFLFFFSDLTAFGVDCAVYGAEVWLFVLWLLLICCVRTVFHAFICD